MFAAPLTHSRAREIGWASSVGHLVARRMRVRSIQRVASKSSSVSILKVVSRVIATAAASWSKPQISVCVSSPVVHLHGGMRLRAGHLAPPLDSMPLLPGNPATLSYSNLSSTVHQRSPLAQPLYAEPVSQHLAALQACSPRLLGEKHIAQLGKVRLSNMYTPDRCCTAAQPVRPLLLPWHCLKGAHSHSCLHIAGGRCSRSTFH